LEEGWEGFVVSAYVGVGFGAAEGCLFLDGCDGLVEEEHAADSCVLGTDEKVLFGLDLGRDHC
jgi:hypothetical protein